MYSMTNVKIRSVKCLQVESTCVIINDSLVLYYPRAAAESLLTWSGMSSASLLALSTSGIQQQFIRVDKLHDLVHLIIDRGDIASVHNVADEFRSQPA